MIDHNDPFTPDLFPNEPVEFVDPREAICHLIADMTHGRDRAAIARQMSDTLGRPVSRAMIDAWASSAREAHNMPVYIAAAFELAVGRFDITNYLAACHGGRTYYGRDAIRAGLDAEQAELAEQRREIARRMRQLRDLRHRVQG